MADRLSFDNGGIFWFFGTKDHELSEILDQKRFYAGNRIIPTEKLIILEQVHQDGVIVADPIISYCGDIPSSIHIPDADGVLTKKENRFLSIFTADCVPVLAYDKRKKAIAAIHSGRTGTQLNIVGKAIDLFFADYRSENDDIQVVLGPAISAPHYSVSDKIFKEFTKATGIEQEYPNLDLKKVIKEQIKERGVTNIEDIDICTFEHPHFYSYRENGTTQRQLSLIATY